jgi:hypothetical protein
MYLFVAYENDRYVGTKVLDFWCPLFWDVVEGVWRVDAKAHQYNIRVWV